jgi:oxaloacetate decarboxylase gamma subunit
VENNLVNDGVELMLFGMGTVVVFLTLLVFVTTAMSALVQRYLPPPPAPPATPGPSEDRDRLMAVIGAAVHKRRSSNRDGNS